VALEAVKVALDPSPTQERLLLSHAGASRFAYNAGLAHIKEALDAGEKPEWSLYGLRRWWNANKDALAVSEDGVIWWGENSKEAYSSGLEALAKGLSN
jgi:transposase